MPRITYTQFRNIVHDYYIENGRYLPWRETYDWYEILVSEIMLQQTQVDRVLPKYKNFLKRFPQPADLARAEFKSVLALWKGLGYNRRAQHLQNAVTAIVKQHRSILPSDYNDLVALPGIGDYTANALMVFVHQQPRIVIETNIRSVYLHHFFRGCSDVHDNDIREKIKKTLDTENPRNWYYALMDYGVHIKKTYGNPNVKSKHYTKQSKFEGSDRQVRGKILDVLLVHPKSFECVQDELQEDPIRLKKIFETLVKDKLIVERSGLFHIA